MSALAAVPDTIDLQNHEAECALVGSFLMHPELVQTHADAVQEEWFTEPAAKWFFHAVKKVSASGSQVSATALLGNLPDSVNAKDRTTLSRLYMTLLDMAVSEGQIAGVIDVVRDRWMRRTLKTACQAVSEEVHLFGSDPQILAGDLLEQIDAVSASRSAREASFVGSSTDKVIGRIGKPDTMQGATTGLRVLDRMINGYRRGQFYVIAGRPAMGKSAFAVSSLVRTALAGHGVGFFSLEMTEDEVISRALADLMDDTRAPAYGAIMKGQVDPAWHDRILTARDRLNEAPLYVDYSPSLTAAEIVSRSRQLQAEMKAKGQRLEVLCIDHLTEVSPSQRYSGNPVMEVSENVKRFRVLAKELDCCVIALAQLSREVEKRADRKPQLSDLRWTGEIEQAAHMVAFLYRDEYYLKSDPNADPMMVIESRNVMEFLIRKNRLGETGDIRLRCSMAHSSVRDAL